jgi:hypothetical protein
MQNKKKIYQKPQLQSIKMLEVGAANCCRTTNGTCNNALRVTKTRTSNAS